MRICEPVKTLDEEPESFVLYMTSHMGGGMMTSNIKQHNTSLASEGVVGFPQETR